MIRLSVLVFMYLVFIMTTPGLSDSDGGSPMEKNSIVSSIAEGLKNANNRARELGYDPEKFHLTITDKLDDLDQRFFLSSDKTKPMWKAIVEGKLSVWKIYYAPKGKVMLGGDLTIYVDRKTGDVLQVWEGE